MELKPHEVLVKTEAGTELVVSKGYYEQYKGKLELVEKKPTVKQGDEADSNKMDSEPLKNKSNATKAKKNTRAASAKKNA